MVHLLPGSRLSLAQRLACVSRSFADAALDGSGSLGGVVDDLVGPLAGLVGDPRIAGELRRRAGFLSGLARLARVCSWQMVRNRRVRRTRGVGTTFNPL